LIFPEIYAILFVNDNGIDNTQPKADI